MIRFLLWVCGTVCGLMMYGQSPANILRDIPASNGFSSPQAIEATFNNARRQEEIQLNLPTNTIGNLILPTGWNQLSEEERMLYLLNDERTSRAGINYGQGPVLGLPFEGVERRVDDVAKGYAQVLFDNDAFTHSFGGSSPFQRVAAAYPTGCREFTSRGENLYAAFSSGNNSFSSAVEQAVYGFNYADAGSRWGHREMNLLQDRDLQGRAYGFTDNHGIARQEGFIGVGVVRGANYRGWNSGVVVVLNYMDPAPSCTYDVLYTSRRPGNDPDNVNGDPCDEPVNISSAVTDPVISSDEQVRIANVTISQATTISSPEIEFGSNFTVDGGTCIQVVNDGCNYTGTLRCETGERTSYSCDQAPVMNCGGTILGDNNGSSQRSTYGTQSQWTGGEAYVMFDQPANTTVTVRLTNLSADLDLFASTSCTGGVFAASTNSGITDESISFSSSTGGRRIIIVDGWNGARSEFRIAIEGCSNAKGDTQVPKSNLYITKTRVHQMVGTPIAIDPN
ncbi:MAG: hypothetical protein AAFQ02_08190 [Bacteroidota bacterium]